MKTTLLALALLPLIALTSSAQENFKPQFSDPVPTPPAERPAKGPRVLLVGGGSSHDFVKFFGATDKATLTPEQIRTAVVTDLAADVVGLAILAVAKFTTLRRAVDLIRLGGALLGGRGGMLGGRPGEGFGGFVGGPGGFGGGPGGFAGGPGGGPGGF